MVFSISLKRATVGAVGSLLFSISAASIAAAATFAYEVTGTGFVDGAQFEGYSTASASFFLGVGYTSQLTTMPYGIDTFHDLDQTESGFFDDFLSPNETVA